MSSRASRAALRGGLALLLAGFRWLKLWGVEVAPPQQQAHEALPSSSWGTYDLRSPREKGVNTFDRVLTLSIPRPDADTVVFPIERGD